MTNYDDFLTSRVPTYFNGTAKLTSLSINLELVMEKILKGGSIKDRVTNWSTTINDEFASLAIGGRVGCSLQQLLAQGTFGDALPWQEPFRKTKFVATTRVGLVKNRPII